MTFTLSKANKRGLLLEATTTQMLCIAIDTPISLGVYLRLKYKEYDQLVNMDISPDWYQDHSNFADDYLAVSVLKKSLYLPLNIDRRQAALDSFWESERQCKDTNDRLWNLARPDWYERFRGLFRGILGPLDRTALQKIERNLHFSGGATTGVRGTGTVKSEKYGGSPHLTVSLYPYYKAILGPHWWETADKPTIVEGNRFTTVPKSAKTDRGICVEPTLNVYVQLGIGAYLKKRLKLYGIDLTDQRLNQTLAGEAYDLGLATIDLSRASDSMSRLLVKDICTEEWYSLLDAARSKKTKLPDDTIVPLEKFSSMGNGFTFELESAVFTAISRCFVPKKYWGLVNVYGDDIIIPADYAEDVIDALNFIGFSVNTKKTCLAGRFFESCGTDYFEGTEVRPFYLRKEIDDRTPYPLRICNALRLYAAKRCKYLACDGRFKPLWTWLYNQIPHVWKHYVPPSFGDTGVITDFTEIPINRSFNPDRIEKNRSPDIPRVRCVFLRPKKRKSSGKDVRPYLLGLDELHQRFDNEYDYKLYKLSLEGRAHLGIDTNLGNVKDSSPIGNGEPVRGFLSSPRSKLTPVFIDRGLSLSWI